VPEPVPTYRFWGSKKPPSNRSEFWSVTNETPTPGGGSKTATLRIHGPIDSWGGAFGISAQDVAGALDNLPADTEEIRVRINSPGGDAWEGMNILNMLRAHDARFVAVVDGLAASAASFIAAGADDTVMSPGSQLMVHDAAGLSLGQAKDMRKMAEALDSVSNSIASVYAAATGGTTEDWRTVMVEETWYTADEAVTAGLAARVEVVPDAKSKVARDGKPESTGDQPENRFDLSIFNHAGRSDAPAPHIPPSAPRSGQPNTEGGPAVAFSDEQITNLRAKLQLPETADEAAIVAAVSAVVEDSLEETPVTPAPTPQATPTPQPTQSAPVAQAPAAPGTMTIDQSAWDAQQARIKALEAQDARRRVEERDKVVDQAVSDGKFKADRKDHYKRVWDADPEGARQIIDGLQKGVIPVNELGYAGDDDAEFDEFAHLFTPKGA
jgi:ATP-dependent protease ClpP protease subunit